MDLERTRVVGSDLGTPSGRALVARVADGAGCGSAVHPHAHAVVDQRLPVSGERLPRLRHALPPVHPRYAYTPIPANAKAYDSLAAECTKMHEYLGRGANEVMHRPRDLRRDALTAGEPS